MIYFDHNASSPMAPAVRQALATALEELGRGNPSSLHAAGRLARDTVERARRVVAERVGAAAAEVVFTSGGSEANLLGLVGLARARRKLDAQRDRIVVGKLEHPSLAAAAASLQGFTLSELENDARGVCILPALDERVAVVSLQLANHELGTLQPVAELVQRAAAHGVWVHTDAVQALDKLSVDFRALGVHAASFSSHKIGGPQGVGALVVRSDIVIDPVVGGGLQERGRRPGTENVLGIVGFAAALAATQGETWSAVGALRDRLERGLIQLGARVHGQGAERVGNTSNVAFAGVDGELLMQNLDLQGVAVSMGAACSSGSVEPSPVVSALGFGAAQARQAVRFSLGPGNTAAEVDSVLALLPEILERIRRVKAH